MTVTRSGSRTRRPSDESVRTATGRAWREWFDTLDGSGAREGDHKEIVAHLQRRHLQRRHHKADAWWRQTIAVEYERAVGGRVVGETAVRAHLEQLPDAQVREAMREHWRAALQRIVAASA